MSRHARTLVRFGCAAMAGVSITALTASEPSAQYKMTVNKERLVNAQKDRKSVV